MHTGGEKDGRLGDTHEEVCEGQVYNKQVGRCPQGPAPTQHAHTQTQNNQLFISLFIRYILLVLCL